MQKRILILGAGNIGRGVIGSIFFDAGYHLTFYDAAPNLTCGLSSQGWYTVDRIGDHIENVTVTDFDVIQAEDETGLEAAIAQETLVACCVYHGAYDALCTHIANAVRQRASKKIAPLNIFLCVNELGSVTYFQERISQQLSGSDLTYFREKVGICQVLVLRAGLPSGDERKALDPYAVTTSLDGHVFIDQDAFLGDKFQVDRVQFVDRIQARMQRKIYTGNMFHCIQAFLGAFHGAEDMPACRAVPGVLDNSLAAYYEAEEALSREYSFSTEDRAAWNEEILGDIKKTADGGVSDPVSRVLARPMEKLSRSNRFIAPALLCIKHNVLPYFLSKGIACGLCYNNPEDSQSVKMQQIIEENGLDAALNIICGLTEKDWILRDLIRGHYQELKK